MKPPPSQLGCLALVVTLAACIDSSPRVASATDIGTTPETGDEIAGDAADPAEPCDTPAATRCRDDARALQICRDGSWQTTTCGDDRLCIDVGGAQCLEASGEAVCRELVYCYLGCAPLSGAARNACEVECYLQGTVSAQSELAAFVGCLDRAGCFGEDLGPVLDCISDGCGTPMAQCYFQTSGSDSCPSIITCRDGCGDEDNACHLGCGQTATLAAQADYGVLELCLVYACSERENDPTCIDEVTGIGGACAKYVRACANPLDN